MAASACAPNPGARASVDPVDAGTSQAGAVSEEIRTALQAAVGGWNRDDLDVFMNVYSDDPSLVGIGSAGPLEGKLALREHYEATWFSGGGEADDLALDEIEVRPLGPESALAHGRYTLFRPGFETQSVTAQGRFTFVLRRESGAWKVIHAHSW